MTWNWCISNFSLFVLFPNVFVNRKKTLVFDSANVALNVLNYYTIPRAEKFLYSSCSINHNYRRTSSMALLFIDCTSYHEHYSRHKVWWATECRAKKYFLWILFTEHRYLVWDETFWDTLAPSPVTSTFHQDNPDGPPS